MKETNLKRDPVKYIRDAVKSRYPKGTSCRICETTELLEFHHYHAVAEMYKIWLTKSSYKQADVLEHRDEFISSHEDELIHKCVTLCKHDHSRLHKIYGKSPKLATAEKQERWVAKQRQRKLDKGS